MPNLFDHIQPNPTAAKRQSPTSVAAAKAAEPRAGSQMSLYITELVKAKHNGLTDHEAAEKLQLPVGTICARRGSEHGKLYVVDSGKTRRSRHGAKNVVWVHRMFAEEGRG